jgi:hypothetical protein
MQELGAEARKTASTYPFQKAMMIAYCRLKAARVPTLAEPDQPRDTYNGRLLRYGPFASAAHERAPSIV